MQARSHISSDEGYPPSDQTARVSIGCMRCLLKFVVHGDNDAAMREIAASVFHRSCVCHVAFLCLWVELVSCSGCGLYIPDYVLRRRPASNVFHKMLRELNTS